MKRTGWVACPACRGSGLQNGLDGAEDCSSCRGQCVRSTRERTGWVAPQLARRLDGWRRIVTRPRPYFDGRKP